MHLFGHLDAFYKCFARESLIGSPYLLSVRTSVYPSVPSLGCLDASVGFRCVPEGKSVRHEGVPRNDQTVVVDQRFETGLRALL
jgi:hypothetical protein